MHLWHFLLTKFSLISFYSGWIFLQIVWPHSITNNKLTATVTKNGVYRYFFSTTFNILSVMDHLWYFSGLRGSLILNPLHLQRNHQLVYFSCSLQYSTSSPAYTGGSYMHGTWDGVSWLRCECWPTCASLWWGRGQWDKQCPGSGRLR